MFPLFPRPPYYVLPIRTPSKVPALIRVALNGTPLGCIAALIHSAPDTHTHTLAAALFVFTVPWFCRSSSESVRNVAPSAAPHSPSRPRPSTLIPRRIFGRSRQTMAPPVPSYMLQPIVAHVMAPVSSYMLQPIVAHVMACHSFTFCDVLMCTYIAPSVRRGVRRRSTVFSASCTARH